MLSPSTRSTTAPAATSTFRSQQQAKLLKELGYDGIGFTGTQHIPEMLKALDAQGLKMFSTYVGACVDADKPPYDPGLKKCLEQLKGRDTLISLYVTGGKPSADTSDDRAVAIFREIADMAEPSECALRCILTWDVTSPGWKTPSAW